VADDEKVLEGIQKFFDECQDDISPDQEVVGFSWSKKGIGFGEFVFITDPDTGEIRCDSEAMSKDFVKEMLCKLVDKSEFF